MSLIRKLRNRLFQNLEFCIHDATLGADLDSSGCHIDTVNICKNDPILPLKTRIAKILLIHFPGVVHHQICYQNITVRSMKALQIFRKSVK